MLAFFFLDVFSLYLLDNLPLRLTHRGSITAMMKMKNPTEAAVHHHDLRTFSSPSPAKMVPIISSLVVNLWNLKTVTLTQRWSGDVYVSLNDVSALRARDDAGIRSRVFLDVWLVKQERCVGQKKLSRVQFNMILPDIEYVPVFCVISQNDQRLRGWHEGPSEWEILQSVRSYAGNGQCVSLFLFYIVWKTTYFSDWLEILCMNNTLMIVEPRCTLLFPRRCPHLGLVGWYKRAKVGMVREVTQNPQRALHSEQTLVVHDCDGWIVQSSLSRGGVCGPGDLGHRVGVVGGADEGLLSHLHDHWYNRSWKGSRNDPTSLVLTSVVNSY